MYILEEFDNIVFLDAQSFLHNAFDIGLSYPRYFALKVRDLVTRGGDHCQATGSSWEVRGNRSTLCCLTMFCFAGKDEHLVEPWHAGCAGPWLTSRRPCRTASSALAPIGSVSGEVLPYELAMAKEIIARTDVSGCSRHTVAVPRAI